MKYNQLVKQFMRYFGAALVGFVADFGTLILLREVVHFHYLLAATCGFTVGLVVIYALSNRYVFGESKIKSKPVAFGLFAVIGVVGLLLLNALMWFFTDQLHINYIVSKIIATIFVYAWNFLARRKLYHD